MRIPLSHSDLKKGRLTKIARALQKILPNEQLSLMRAQNALASLLGYRDLHDLQACAVATVTANNPVSRTEINTSVGWKLFRNHGLNLNTAADLAKKLHLQMLDVDSATPEAAFESALKSSGQPMMRDEFFDYINPSWNERTPRLLDAGIPGYSYAVLPNKTVFRWSLLDDLLSKLPADFVEDLKTEPRYKNFADEGALEMAFIKQEVYPQACSTLLDATKRARILPAGFKIMWIFSDGGDHIGECLGQVLYNEALGGIIPVIYPKDTDNIFDAAGQLLCGEVISSHVLESDSSDGFVFVYRLAYDGYDVNMDIKPVFGKDKIKASDMDRLPAHIRFRHIDGKPVFTGKTFVENGQTYLRHQNWMIETDVPAHIMSPSESVLVQSNYLNSYDTVPEAARKLLNSASTCRKKLFEEALSNLRSEQGIANLVTLFFDTVKCMDFDAYCTDLINYYFEDEDLLTDERSRIMDRMERNGVEIKKVCPFLADLNDATLGYVLLRANGEYPGGRNSFLVFPPQVGDLEGLSKLLLCLLFHGVCFKGNHKLSYFHGVDDALAHVVNRVINGFATSRDLFDEYATVSAFCKLLDKQNKFLDGIQKWRKENADMQEIRGYGEFLYVGEPVVRQKPKGLSELYAMSSSSGFHFIPVKQTLYDYSGVSL